MRIVVIYRTPYCPIGLSDQLFKAISDLVSCDRSCIVVGDFNMPEIDWNGNLTRKGLSAVSKSFLNLCQTHNLSQHVRSSTLDKNTLDLVLSTNPEIISDIRLGAPVGSSDHKSITFNLNISRQQPILVARRNFKDADFDKINQYLLGVDWYGSFGSVLTVNDMYELFIAILHHVIDEFIPLSEVPANQMKLPSHLKALATRRAAAWDQASRTGSPTSWNTFRKLNRKFECRLKKYNSFIEKKVIESGSKASFYKFLKSKLNAKAKLGPIRKEDNTIVTTDLEKAEVFAKVLEKFYTSCDETGSVSSDSKYPMMEDSIWFHAEEVHTLLAHWPTSYSRTPDDLPLHFIKNVASVISAPLAFIFNLSFMRAEVPYKWNFLL
ncbi:hypothetical protein Y032_0378g294 [Ancylostoma ceylanicum]|uniref:Endonuclease/exonuclease/phosphatase domain-containing protein n=1 Tax=Ancylostoma ceylanicum TaxID=53326 RepID=A0A016RU59_9BILA|nr:hypothetical protein Y032_0378g294 [Ancylostoma ceylanicum]